MSRNKLGQFTSDNVGKKHPRWRGGKTIDRYGYPKLLKPDCPMSDSKGYVYEHRYKMAKKIGRLLTREDVVHHINGIRDDNRIENLELTTHFEHKSKHSKKKSNLPKNGFSYKRKCVVCDIEILGGNRKKYCRKHRTY